MPVNEIRFNDGATYERYMGKWSQRVGQAFLDWLAPIAGLRWLDVGCGNGAFTELLVERCAPRQVIGIDPSDAQLEFARTRPASRDAQFQLGNAMAIPFEGDSFDAAVMPLVIFFVPDPAKGVAEMTRVVCPGGIVAAYGWDLLAGGFPYQNERAELQSMGLSVPEPPSRDAASMEVMRDLWRGAGLDAIETREIHVHRVFDDFDDYWTTLFGGPSIGPLLRALPPDELTALQARIRARLEPDATGRIHAQARANAIKGRVPV